MFFADSQDRNSDPDLIGDESDDNIYEEERSLQCSEGHRSSLCLGTEQGGSICLVCFSNLITNPHAPTFHVSYALSQLSVAFSDSAFLHSFLCSHPLLLVSPLITALSLFDDDPIACQIVRLIATLCGFGNASLCDEFVCHVADSIASGVLAWSRRQVYMLHCFGVLLNCCVNNPYALVKDRDGLVSNLVTGLQLPSEEIRGEILFVLYKISILQSDDGSSGADSLFTYCPKLLHLSLEALLKTQDDTVRMNCVALLATLTRKGFFENVNVNGVNRMSCDEADSIMHIPDDGQDGTPLCFLFSEAIKGPLLSTDRQIQISTLDLIYHYLLGDRASIKRSQLLIQQNIVDYIFEILRLSECKDPIVSSCILVLQLFLRAEKGFIERLVFGYSTLIPALRHVAELPFHPAQHPTLELVWKGISDCPGIISTSHIEEIVLILTRMFKRHTDGKVAMSPESFKLLCSIFVALLESPFHGTSNLIKLVEEAAEYAISACLDPSGKDYSDLLHALYLLKEAYSYSLKYISSDDSCVNELQTCIIDICTSNLLPWIITSMNDVDEEIILGILETFHHILLHDSSDQTTRFAKMLVKSAWFSLSFGYLGIFPTEKMKWRIYQLLSSLVEILLNDPGTPIRDAASHLPTDPMDLLVLLGQKRSKDKVLSTCQSAIFLILHAISLYDDRLADERSLLASLDQYILVNGGDFLCGSTDSFKMMQLVNLYGCCRGFAKMTYQVPYSPEAERIFFHIINENEFDLPSSRVHITSLKWLFQQEKISRTFSCQMIKFCRSNWSNDKVPEEHTLSVQVIGELTSSGDNYMARILVNLLIQLVEDEGQEHDIVSLLDLLTTVINIFPAATPKLCLDGLSNAIRTLCFSRNISSSPPMFDVLSLLIFDVLCSVQPEALSDEEPWIAITLKLMDCLIATVAEENLSKEGLRVIAIFSLILHNSTKRSLLEASKTILFSASMFTMVNSVIQAACSKGPALLDYDDRTSLGENLVFVLLLYYFSVRSLEVVISGDVDWQNLLDSSNKTQPLYTIGIYVDDLCRLMYFGSSAVKLVASHCLLEFIARFSKQRNKKHEDLKCSKGYLISIISVLQGLVHSSDIRVAMNSAICISIILGWENLDMGETRIIAKDTWCRLIVEEMAMSLAVPCLTSKSFVEQHHPAILVSVALLKLRNPPPWMREVFDTICISSIIDNLATSNITIEMVLLFQELCKSGISTDQHKASINRVFQECRRCIYVEDDQRECQDNHLEMRNSMENDLGKFRGYLTYLMSSITSPDTEHGALRSKKKRLLEEIEIFQDMSNA